MNTKLQKALNDLAKASASLNEASIFLRCVLADDERNKSAAAQQQKDAGLDVSPVSVHEHIIRTDAKTFIDIEHAKFDAYKTGIGIVRFALVSGKLEAQRIAPDGFYVTSKNEPHSARANSELKPLRECDGAEVEEAAKLFHEENLHFGVRLEPLLRRVLNAFVYKRRSQS